MNSNSWSNFLNDSNQLSKPARAQQIISEQDVTETKLLLNDVLKGFLTQENLHMGLKTYVNGELRNDFIDQMAMNPPSAEASLKDWSHEIFGDQKFGMILIGLEQYSNAFAEKAATIVRPLLETAGLPLNGLSFLFFMGNYGFTPFGIHKEATGEDGVLFHLGPEHKHFYTWDDPKYNAIEHNTEVFHNIPEMLPEGKAHELAPGDAMFIPHYVYHVANTPKFSMSFVLDYINPPKDRFENELLKETGEEGLVNQNEYENPLKLEAPLSDLSSILNFNSIQKKLETSLRRKMMGLKSNGGIGRKSKISTTTIPSMGTFSIKGKKVFPIHLEIQTPEKVLLFARGHRIPIKDHPGLTELVKQLNSSEVLSLDRIKRLMAPMNLGEVYGLIQELLLTEAVTLEEIQKEKG
ncbi:RNA methylase [Roseivirga sp. E12]|uniref:RNA methylase n=1 Tax=Roseivirga sp. E12 TaxID=2819237 RepID=UPI001ABC4259|nr:RNA methylase [Roseivirga sp. E12]MBO3697582.1 RNA methylase [Roseivirga sp. E12]